jgi:hypothetical protein
MVQVGGTQQGATGPATDSMATIGVTHLVAAPCVMDNATIDIYDERSKQVVESYPAAKLSDGTIEDASNPFAQLDWHHPWCESSQYVLALRWADGEHTSLTRVRSPSCDGSGQGELTAVGWIRARSGGCLDCQATADATPVPSATPSRVRPTVRPS